MEQREVDEELDSLLSSFTFNSDIVDPLAKAEHPGHFCGLINPHGMPSIPHPSVPPCIRLFNPSEAEAH